MSATITIAGRRQATRAPADYLRLVAEFPLRPISSAAEYDAAAAILDRLVVRQDLSRGQRDYLDALTLFVEAYDEQQDAAETERQRRRQQGQAADVSPVEMLKALMEHRGMTTTDLGKLLGSKGAASEILHRKRGISKRHMARLAEHFRVDAGVFLGDA
jgi:HTH-type transcriptional regulator/antitoxin HigA